MKIYTNTTPEVVYMDGRRIEPNESASVPDWCVPDEDVAAPVVVATEEDAALKALLRLSVAEVLAEVSGKDAATLAKLEALESAGRAPRKSLLAALAEARLALASAQLEEGAAGISGGAGVASGTGSVHESAVGASRDAQGDQP